MKVEFNNKQKYLNHVWETEEHTFRLYAQLPFRLPGQLKIPPGNVQCYISPRGDRYQIGHRIYYRKEMYDKQEVRDLYRMIADLIPDAETIRGLWEIEKMEDLL